MTNNIKKPSQTSWAQKKAFFLSSLSHNKRDFTVAPIKYSLGLLAIPMMLEMSMEAIFAVVDIVFVSWLGTNAIAAVGITEAIVTVLYAIATGLGITVTAMVSRRIGEKKPGTAAKIVGQTIWIGALISIITGCIGVLYAPDLLRLLGASEAVITEGKDFASILLGGSFSIVYLFLLNAAFRGAGDATVALRSLTIANLLNIILDPCLIFGLGPFPELGVTGAAVATTIGRTIGVSYLLYFLFVGNGRVKLASRDLILVPSLIKRIFRVSLYAIGQFLITTSSWIVLIRIIALFGTAPVAAYTVTLRLMEFVWLPCWGLGNATATLVGQNLGAKKPERAKQTVWEGAKYNLMLMTLLGLIQVIFAPQIISLFSTEQEVIRHGINCLRIIGAGFPAYAIGMIIIQSLNGAGDMITPSIMNFICFWLIQIPLAYWLSAIVNIGPSGVFIAIILSETLLTVMAVWFFRKDSWLKQQI